MLRKLILLALLLELAQSAWAVPALVRKAPSGGIAGGNNAGTTVTCAFASNSAGNMIFAWGATDASSGVITVADTIGNTYTAIQATLNQSRVSVRTFAAYNIATSGVTNTLTFTSTVSAPNSFYCGAGEYSGLATSAALDQTNNNNITVGVTAWSSNNVTTTVASELFVGVAVGGDGSQTLAVGTNVAWVDQGHTVTGDRSPGWEDFIASSTQTVDAKFTYSGTTTGFCIIDTFQVPAVAGGGSAKKKKVIFY